MTNTKHCNICNTTKPSEEFWETHKNQCKDCRRNYRKQYEKRNREKLALKAKEKTILRKKQLVDLFGSCCSICQNKYHQSALDFHHVIDDKTEKGVAYFLQSSLKRAKEEADKCILICANCHRFLHFACNELHNKCIENKHGYTFEELQYFLTIQTRRRLDEFNSQTLTNESSCKNSPQRP